MTTTPPRDGPVHPEVLDGPSELPAPGTLGAAGAPGAAGAAGAAGDGSADGEDSEAVTQPTKLIRIASMVRSLLDEARRAPLDDAGRRLLREIHEKSLTELEGVLSGELQAELAEVTLPFTSATPSESELRIAQAQLVGWLEGLFHGIQATLFTQQMQAQRQFEDMRGRRMLEGPPDARQQPGAYL